MKKRRNTPTKAAVLNVLTKAGKALSQDAIEQQIAIAIDRATIYRVLNRFCDDGILHKVIAQDGKQYFALCSDYDQKQPTQQHFHFRCTVCQTLECLPNDANFSIPKGYLLQHVNCVITGVCKACA